MPRGGSKKAPQIHARVKRPESGIAFEHERLALKQLAQPPLLRLAPARMIDGRIDVRIEAVFLGRHLVPGGLRLPFREVNPDYRLDAFESILPRQRKTQRCAVLVREHAAVE